MNLRLITALIRVRCGLSLEKCCNYYEIPINVKKQIGSKESFQSDTDNNGADKNYLSEDGLILNSCVLLNNLCVGLPTNVNLLTNCVLLYFVKQEFF